MIHTCPRGERGWWWCLVMLWYIYDGMERRRVLEGGLDWRDSCTVIYAVDMIKGRYRFIGWYPCIHVQLTLSLLRHGADTRAQPAVLNQPWIVHQVPIAAGWTEAVCLEGETMRHTDLQSSVLLLCYGKCIHVVLDPVMVKEMFTWSKTFEHKNNVNAHEGKCPWE